MPSAPLKKTNSAVIVMSSDRSCHSDESWISDQQKMIFVCVGSEFLVEIVQDGIRVEGMSRGRQKKFDLAEFQRLVDRGEPRNKLPSLLIELHLLLNDEDGHSDPLLPFIALDRSGDVSFVAKILDDSFVDSSVRHEIDVGDRMLIHASPVTTVFGLKAIDQLEAVRIIDHHLRLGQSQSRTTLRSGSDEPLGISSLESQLVPFGLIFIHRSIITNSIFSEQIHQLVDIMTESSPDDPRSIGLVSDFLHDVHSGILGTEHMNRLIICDRNIVAGDLLQAKQTNDRKFSCDQVVANLEHELFFQLAIRSSLLSAHVEITLRIELRRQIENFVFQNSIRDLFQPFSELFEILIFDELIIAGIIPMEALVLIAGEPGAGSNQALRTLPI